MSLEILKLVIDSVEERMVPRKQILDKVQLSHRMSVKGLWECIEPDEALKYKYIEVVAINGSKICSGNVTKTVFYCHHDLLNKGIGGKLMLGDYKANG